MNSTRRSSAALFTDMAELVVSSVTTAPATSSRFQIGCAADMTTARPSRVRRVWVAAVPCSAAATSGPVASTSSGCASAKSSVGRGISQPISGCHQGVSEATSAARRRLPAAAITW